MLLLFFAAMNAPASDSGADCSSAGRQDDRLLGRVVRCGDEGPVTEAGREGGDLDADAAGAGCGGGLPGELSVSGTESEGVCGHEVPLRDAERDYLVEQHLFGQFVENATADRRTREVFIGVHPERETGVRVVRHRDDIYCVVEELGFPNGGDLGDEMRVLTQSQGDVNVVGGRFLYVQPCPACFRGLRSEESRVKN